ncbi:efflux RND transporter periplasmic adaptor subunit [Desulfatitalea alkaliphila]|uniref:Efflux RND transporter periplasmic adaptor subunit n=1 Tax=Desulfatitalea alkaliphila TaxID=2929485 RepID=A0AA41R1H4_9BACT|nr:efflux RND transporter periplasmic adaptor subunit [Desulfatitalea alkaliphila]MCJ8500304.1 efflux RND transporter periplasmic adaptor subunit [Desulfatitalea alkaliphila]
MGQRYWGVLVGVLVLLVGCGEKIGPGTSAPAEREVVRAPVAEARVSQEPFQYEAVATINARTGSTIAAKLLGTVQAVHVRQGDRIKAGDLLVTIDPRTVSAQLEQAQAALNEARRAETSALSARDAAAAAAELAEGTFRRYEQLRAENSVSDQEFDEVQSRFRQARATLSQTEAMVAAARSRVQQAEAALRQADVARGDARVMAPYDGRVVNKMVEEGDMASPGTPLLTVEQEGLYCADLVLPERHIQAVREGMAATVVVPALDNIEVEGTVGRIVPAADARSRSFEIKVAMPEGLDLKTGMFARVRIPLGGTGVLLVPESAVRQEGQLTGIFVVDEEMVARFRLVRIGTRYGDRVEVISGLGEGQRYVTEAPPTLRDGMRVEAIQ